MKTEYLIWCDLETTGLNPVKDKILEIAVIITDMKYEEITRYHALVSNATITDMHVKEMHTKTGLLDELAAVEKFPTLKELTADLNALLPDTNAIYYFAGNSVDFDMGFLRKHTPDFTAHASHRKYDTTTLMMAKRIQNPDIEFVMNTKGTVHRAMDDIENSLAFARLHFAPKKKLSKWQQLLRFMGGKDF